MTHLTHYQELTILPDPEISSYFIWGKLITQLHIALADIKNQYDIDNIGISFPDYYFDSKNGKSSKLGSKLRIFAPSSEALEKLNLNNWLDRLTDYVHIKSIKEVGNQAKGHVVVRRYNYKNVKKQAEQYAKHKGIDYKEALSWCKEHKQSSKPYPFINLKSETNKQNFKLAIVQEMVDSPAKGSFNQYGINNATGTTTVPYW